MQTSTVTNLLRNAKIGYGRVYTNKLKAGGGRIKIFHVFAGAAPKVKNLIQAAFPTVAVNVNRSSVTIYYGEKDSNLEARDVDFLVNKLADAAEPKDRVVQVVLTLLVPNHISDTRLNQVIQDQTSFLVSHRINS